ncbi:hypothetical protein PFY12_11015 [Chryseobacterium camelliae]|uniref:Uncharacterized protein n=1 Tax=Chryseobacterium camelliae TaxID=1265445 RepID=A0ABY7QIW7_9FLAO|nr:hypothetical protein [Chryseobacterium camelliae]WBV59587.1 hypothetical protein PFY12_11015 [Chryseobacterium camelliae]
MKKIILVLFGSISLLINGQIGNENISYSTGNFFMKANRPSTKEYIVDGSPYSNGDQFNKVIIKDYSKNVQDLRYNAYEDEMEFKNGDELFYANKENNLKIHFPTLNKTYKCFNYNYDGKSKLGYLVVLVDSPKYSFFKREKVELLRGEKSPNAYSKDANDYYAKEKDLYLVSKNNILFKFPKNIGEASEFFSVDKKEMESFVKSNKINFNKEIDMVKLVEFINK